MNRILLRAISYSNTTIMKYVCLAVYDSARLAIFAPYSYPVSWESSSYATAYELPLWVSSYYGSNGRLMEVNLMAADTGSPNSDQKTHSCFAKSIHIIPRLQKSENSPWKYHRMGSEIGPDHSIATQRHTTP